MLWRRGSGGRSEEEGGAGRGKDGSGKYFCPETCSLRTREASLTSPSYLVRNRTRGPPLQNNPEIPPSSRDEGLRLEVRLSG